MANRKWRIREISTLALAAFALAVPAWAQEPDQENAGSVPTGPGDVYINESFEATDALNKARALISQARWREAAELLQKASEGLADRVVRTPQGYVGLRSHVAALICTWPEEGVRAYQSLFEPNLQRELRALGDVADIDAAVSLFNQYFCTAGAAAMADRMAQVAIESGDLELARWVLRRVLDDHPARKTHQTRYESLLAIILAMQGQPPEELVARLGETRLRWKGRDAALKDVIANIASEFDSVHEQASADDWPVFAGNPQRNRVSQTSVDEPGLLWRYSLRRRLEGAKPDGIMDGLVRSTSERGLGISVFPAVAGNLVYVQSHRDIAALHRNSGAIAWTLRSEEPDTESFSYTDDRPLGGESPALDDGRLFAALPTFDSTYYDYETARTVHELVALDALTGAVLWRVAQKGVDAQGTATAYDSAPVARHGRVYIVSRRRRSFGFEDCYLDAYRAADGKLLFRTHLASASTSALGLRGATKSIAALHSDHVYVCTNLGTIASVGAYTGGVRWLHMYDRFRPDPAGSSGWPGRESGIVPFNPVIWTSDRIVTLPTDSPKLLVLSAADGKPVHEIPLTGLADMHSLLGVRGDVVCGIGDAALCHDWSKNETLWSARFAEEKTIAGRGMWVDGALLIPFRDQLTRINAQNGTSEALAMGPHYEGGNVLALPEQILIAGADELSCFVRKAEIWKSIRDRMAAAPNDPLPALEFAEIALGAGETTSAMEALREAIRRIEPSISAAQPAVRSRVLADALQLLQSLSTKDGSDVDELFRYASDAASDSASQVEYRIRFAEFFENAGTPRRAIRLYQQILRDRTLRDWPPAQSDAAVVRSHVGATARIEELIKQHGPEVYAEFETEARQWLEAARAAGDEAKLQQLLETFPNSAAASESLVAHAELLVRQGRFLAGAHAWERAYKQLRDAAQRPALIRRIAESYERAGKPELAYLWLTKAAREYPAAMFEQEGRTTTFAASRDRLSSARVLVEPSRAKVSLPLALGYEHDLVGPVQLLSPRFPDEPTTHWGYFYVLNPDGIRGYRADDGKPQWDQPAPVRMNAELLTARADFAVFATPFEVFALQTATGARRYSVGEYPSRLLDAGADWEDGTSFRTHALYADRLVSVREDGTATCLDLRTGDVVWSVTRRPAPLGPMCLNDSVLAYHVSREGKAVIHVASAATGELLETVLTDETRPVEDLHITLDGRLVTVTSKSLACYDTGRQERKWQISFNWPIRKATMLFDMDSAYFIDDAGVLKKIGLDDGRTVWESERVLGRGDENETLQRESEYLIVSTRSSVSAVDVANGLHLWQGTTPENPRFIEREITSFYVAALHVPEAAGASGGEIYFYDHRNASGVIPRVGGVLELGPPKEIRGMLATDGAMVVLSGTKVYGYTRKQ